MKSVLNLLINFFFLRQGLAMQSRLPLNLYADGLKVVILLPQPANAVIIGVCHQAWHMLLFL
jgi:hypothetical protein